MGRTLTTDRKAMLSSLMQIIAAPADPESLASPGSAEECAFNPGELAGLAAQLVRMLLELYGETNIFQTSKACASL